MLSVFSASSIPIGAISALIASLSAFLITPISVKISEITGALDIPDGKRKINVKIFPRLGGLGFFFGFALGAIIFTVHEALPLGGEEFGLIGALLSSGAILVSAGVSDDTAGLSPPVKFLLQSAAAFVAMLFIPMPTSFSFFGLFEIPLSGVFGFFFVFFRLIFTINAVNFSDGLDGLASGLSITALTALSALGIINGKYTAAIVSLILAFAVLGFLPYNRYEAKIYMGDSGSQFLGLAIALISLSVTKNNSYTIETSLFLFIPTLDTILSVLRRLLHGKSPFTADRGHLHHALLSRGVRHPDAVKLLVSASALVALLTLGFSF